MKNNEIVHLNKEIWIPGIEKEIAGWEEFSESIFCQDPADKQNALDHANELRKFLAMVEADTLTRKQYEFYRFTYFN